MALALTQSARDELHNEAKRHTSFETFQQELLRLADNVWHHSRGDKDHAANQGDNSATEGVETDEPETNVVPDQDGQNTAVAQPEEAPNAEEVATHTVTPEAPKPLV